MTILLITAAAIALVMLQPVVDRALATVEQCTCLRMESQTVKLTDPCDFCVRNQYASCKVNNPDGTWKRLR